VYLPKLRSYGESGAHEPFAKRRGRGSATLIRVSQMGATRRLDFWPVDTSAERAGIPSMGRAGLARLSFAWNERRRCHGG